jgi:hypothetical protein
MQKRTKVILGVATAGLVGLAAVGGAVAGHKHRDHGMYGGEMHGMHGGGWGKHGRHGMRGHMKQFAKRYDANNDKKISQEEIDTNRPEWHKKFDADGNGTIDLKEFEALWLEAKRHRMAREFQRLDEDASGQITLGEYLEPMSGIVERMDRNGDGVLSREDRGRHGKHKHRMHEMQDGQKQSSE